MLPVLYTLGDVAAMVRRSPGWLQRFLRDKPIGRMAGRARLFTDADVERVRLALLAEVSRRVGRALTDRPGQIYFIEAGDFIKIGYTRSPVARVRKMLTDSPFELRILHAEAGTFKQEKVVHRHFGHLRVRGEWFQKTPELLRYIEQRAAGSK